MAEIRRELLTIGQAAARLGVSVRTIRAWADAGLISVVKLPSGYRRFEPDVVEAKARELGFQPSNAEEPEP